MTGTNLQMPVMSALSALRGKLLPTVQSQDGLVCTVQHVVRRSQAPCKAAEMLFEKEDPKCGSSSLTS